MCTCHSAEGFGVCICHSEVVQSEDSFRELNLTFHHVDSRNQTQATRLGGNYL